MAKTREKEIDDALKLIEFPGNKIEYLKKYKPFLDLVTKDPNKILTYSNIVISFCLDNIKNKIMTRYRETDEIKFGFKRFKNSLNKFVDSFNNRGKSIKLKLPIIRRTNDKQGFFALFSIIQISNTQQVRKSKVNLLNIRNFFSLYLSKDEKKCYFFKGSDWAITYVSWWLMSKLKIRFRDYELKEYKSVNFQKFLTDKNIRIYELGLNKTEISISDKIIIKSRKGEGLDYYNKLRNSSILRNKGLSIYDLDYLTFSYKDNKKIRLNFKRKKGYNIMLQIASKFKEQLPTYLKSKQDILLFDKVDERELIKYFIHRRYLDRYDYQNHYIKPILEELKKLKVVKIIPFYHYRCSNPSCPYFFDKRSSSKSLCECGELSKNRFIFYYNIEINYDKIIALLGKGLKKEGYGKYKKMPENYLNFQNSPILRVKDEKDNYYYILINEKGLSEEDLTNLRINGIPMILINLRGEVTSTVSEFNNVNSGDLVFSLIKSDYSLLNSILKNLEEKNYLLKINSFEQALKNLKKRTISPSVFEKSVFSLFNLIFSECQKWGGPKLADGSFPIKTIKTGYLLWDAKRYDISSLLEYVDKKALKKDIKYMEEFNENKIIKNFGSVKYYMFVTSNTDKDAFLGMKDSIKKQIKQIKTKKKLRRVKIICMNKDQLIKLAEFFKKDYEKLTRKYDRLIKIIRRGLVSNEGYFNFNHIKKDLKELLKEIKLYPPASELRKK